MDFWEGVRVEFEKLVEMVTEHYGKGIQRVAKKAKAAGTRERLHKEAHGLDEGQITECREQLEGVHFILQMTARLLDVRFSKKVC